MPTVIDLFAGAGGLSLGAARAGFNVTAAVELDSFALETHNKNFPQTIHIPRDVAGLSGDDLLRFADVLPGGLDGLIGGPPCQGFSSIGQQRMDDTRNNLFIHFFRLVQETRPKFFLAENVPGILNEKYDGIRNTAFNLVGNNYNLLDPVIIKASDYGAPTIRTRVFFIGYDPQHMNDIVPNDFSPPIDVESTKVKIALSGLPVNISPHWQAEISGWREIATIEDSRFFDRIVNNVPNGLGNQPALDLYFGKGMVSGCLGTRHSKEVEDRYKSLEYGQQDRISRSIRLDPEGFCPTLRAGTARDRGSYQAVRPIHYEKPRVITPREAARLQGFPDWFVFHSTKWHSFRQIGNSVSPIVSELILSVLNSNLQ